MCPQWRPVGAGGAVQCERHRDRVQFGACRVEAREAGCALVGEGGRHRGIGNESVVDSWAAGGEGGEHRVVQLDVLVRVLQAFAAHVEQQLSAACRETHLWLGDRQVR